jgi:hypothetical protein
MIQLIDQKDLEALIQYFNKLLNLEFLFQNDSIVHIYSNVKY